MRARGSHVGGCWARSSQHSAHLARSSAREEMKCCRLRIRRWRWSYRKHVSIQGVSPDLLNPTLASQSSWPCASVETIGPGQHSSSNRPSHILPWRLPFPVPAYSTAYGTHLPVFFIICCAGRRQGATECAAALACFAKGGSRTYSLGAGEPECSCKRG